MRAFHHRASGVFAFIAIAASCTPALADNVTGAYACRTSTNATLKLQLVQTGSSVTGQYIVDRALTVGHLAGTLTDDFKVNYRWTEREDEGLNTKSDAGWGVISFGNQGANVAWGRPADRQSIGGWTCSGP